MSCHSEHQQNKTFCFWDIQYSYSTIIWGCWMTPNYCLIRWYSLCWIWWFPQKTMHNALFHIVFRWGGPLMASRHLHGIKCMNILGLVSFPWWLFYLFSTLSLHLWVPLPTITWGVGRLTARLWTLLQMSLVRASKTLRDLTIDSIDSK